MSGPEGSRAQARQSLRRAGGIKPVEFKVTEDSRGDWLRNVVSLRASVELFADLVRHPSDARVLVEHELATKPIPIRDSWRSSDTPERSNGRVTHRNFS